MASPDITLTHSKHIPEIADNELAVVIGFNHSVVIITDVVTHDQVAEALAVLATIHAEIAEGAPDGL